MAKFDYDNISDSLFVSVKKENERVEGSAEVGDIIFDFTKEGKIVNIEIREISTYLSNIQILDKLTEVDLKITVKGNSFVAFVILKAPNMEQKVPLVVPTTRPILA